MSPPPELQEPPEPSEPSVPAELPSHASMLEILAAIQSRLARGAEAVTLEVLDPDRAPGSFPGEPVEIAGRVHVHRPWRVWVELADRLELRLCTPRRLEPPVCELRFERLARAGLGRDRDPKIEAEASVQERYGVASEFARIRKAEEPSFVLDLADALARVFATLDPATREPDRPVRILSLGVNTGAELELIVALRPELRDRASFVGVDHSGSAIAAARARFPDPRHRFIEADLAALTSLELGRFDLIIAFDVLQSPGVDDRTLLRRLVQDQLGQTGALILGLPNCRYRDGELVHGARMKNFSQPELSLLVADLAFYRRYLHQHRRKVFITGTHELLLVAV